MKNFKIWKNTSALDDYSDGLNFTNDKQKADIILLGSRSIDISQFPNLKGIFRAGVGKDNVPFQECNNRKIYIEFPSEKTTNILFEETSNYTVSLILRMLYLSPDINPPWKKNPRKSLEKKNALIVGTGNIGSRVKYKLAHLMQVVSYDIMENEAEELESLIKKADVISLHIPNMPENDNFMDKQKLNWMKHGAILINTARANLVNEEALYESISKGNIKAAFDVFWNEPYSGKLTKFYPDSFYMSPHIASSSEDFFLGCRNDLDRMNRLLSK
ncbi:MAG: hydroxyacid dehydrogenase [Candidatus Marinimicrobia bacterium]|nr:hydroxyacid dehydrogenase [Candidatus Neomarinimicrobiota bacterium]